VAVVKNPTSEEAESFAESEALVLDSTEE